MRLRNCGCLKLHDTEADCCGNCQFFACFGCTYPHEGKCQRHAPVVGDMMGEFPKVHRSDWCGDYERRAMSQEPT